MVSTSMFCCLNYAAFLGKRQADSFTLEASFTVLSSCANRHVHLVQDEFFFQNPFFYKVDKLRHFRSRNLKRLFYNQFSLQDHMRRSEERRVGKECRSGWSRYQ